MALALGTTFIIFRALAVVSAVATVPAAAAFTAMTVFAALTIFTFAIRIVTITHKFPPHKYTPYGYKIYYTYSGNKSSGIIRQKT